jgi:hypothetical protein
VASVRCSPEKAESGRTSGWSGGQPSPSAEWPAEQSVSAIAAEVRHGLAQPFLIKVLGGSEAHLNSCNASVDCAGADDWRRGTHVGLIEPYLIRANRGGGDRCRSVDRPLPTMTCGHRGGLALIEPFLVH